MARTLRFLAFLAALCAPAFARAAVAIEHTNFKAGTAGYAALNLQSDALTVEANEIIVVGLSSYESEVSTNYMTVSTYSVGGGETGTVTWSRIGSACNPNTYGATEWWKGVPSEQITDLRVNGYYSETESANMGVFVLSGADAAIGNPDCNDLDTTSHSTVDYTSAPAGSIVLGANYTEGGTATADSGTTVGSPQGSGGGSYQSIFYSSSTVSGTGTIGVTHVSGAVTNASGVTVTPGYSFDHEGFQWYTDAGATVGAQDVDLTDSAGANHRLRILLNATGDPGTQQFTLQYKKSTESSYRTVGTSANESGSSTTTISASADDAQETARDTVTDGATIGAQLDATTEWIGMRFTGHGIPKGATITSAYLSVVPNSSTLDEPLVTIYAEAADNSAQFAAGTDTDNISGRSRTSSVSWSSTDLGANGTAYFNSPDISSLVQAVIDRSGWAAGNPITIIVQGGSSSTRDLTVEAYDTGPGTNPPKLIVNWTVPAAIKMYASANVTHDATTSASLTAPSGKNSGTDFDAGRYADTANPASSVTVSADDYTEMEWSITSVSGVVADGDVYDFSVAGVSGTSAMPNWTIGTSGINLEGTAAVSSAATGTLTAYPQLAGSASSAATAIAALTAHAQLTGTAAGEATGIGTVTVSAPPSGEISVDSGPWSNVSRLTDGTTDLSVTGVTTGANVLLVAAVAANAGNGIGNAYPTLSGGGLTWTRQISHSIYVPTQTLYAQASIYTAWSSSGLSDATITATFPTSTNANVRSLAVIAFSGTTETGFLGATSTQASPPTGRTVTLTPQASGSMVVVAAASGGGNTAPTWDTSTATALASQGTGGSVGSAYGGLTDGSDITLGITTPTYNYYIAALEIKPDGGGTPAALAGTADAQATATGALTITKQLVGSAAGELSTASALTVTKQLVGTAAAQTTATAALTGRPSLVGTATGAATATAAVTTAIRLVGTAAGQATATAALTLTKQLQGTAAGQLVAVGTLADNALAGSAAGALSAVASLTGRPTLAGAAAGSATAAAAVTTAIRVAGSAAAQATASAAVTTAIRLVGSAAGSATATAAVTTAIRLAGTAAGVLTATGELPTTGAALEGVVAGALTATATLTAYPSLVGAAAGQLAASAALTAYPKLAGAAAGALAATGALTGRPSLAGAATGALSASANVSLTAWLAGTADAVLSAGTAALTCQAQLAGLAVGRLTATGALSTGANCADLEAEVQRLQAIIDDLTKRSGTLRHSDGGTLR